MQNKHKKKEVNKWATKSVVSVSVSQQQDKVRHPREKGNG